MITVCMATHNGEKYIIEQLNSILSQLSDKDEVIISDDGSTDQTVSLIQSFQDSRIHLYSYTQTENYKGKHLSSYYYATANFYNALLKAKGDVIFLSDQDDIWADNKVEKSLYYLEFYDIVSSNFSIIDSDGKLIESTFWKGDLFDNLNQIKLWKYLPFRGCCLAFKKEVLLNAMPFPEHLFLHDCWIGLNAVYGHYKFKFINDPLLLYRRHGNNVSLLDSPNSLLFKLKYRYELFIQMLSLRWVKMFNNHIKSFFFQ